MAGLVLINNSELNLPNMWDCLSADVFIGVYVLKQWIDQKIEELSESGCQAKGNGSGLFLARAAFG